MTTADRSANGLPWLRFGLDAWGFGLETSMLAMRAVWTISEAPFRALPTRSDSTALALTTLAIPVQTAEPMQRGEELLTAVLPQNGPDERPRSRHVVPWRDGR